MKLKSKFWFKTIGLLTLSVIMFSLTSKGPKQPPPPTNDYCTDLGYDDFTINILFHSSTYSNPLPGRNNYYEYYIPQNDIRNGYLNPASDLTVGSSYYGVVTVTSPECSDFNWTRRISSTNGANQVMDIKVPDAAVKTRIKIEYYEACGNGNWAEYGSRLKYVAEKNYMSSPSGTAADPLYLIAAQLVPCLSNDGGSGIISPYLDEFESEPIR